MGGTGLVSANAVRRFELRSASGISAAVLTYGGILQRIDVPDRDGRPANVTLGFDDVDGYLSDDYMRRMPFYGALIGRYANRIAHGRFSLDGVTYELPINHAPNSLHGGATGFHTRLWDPEPIDGGLRLRLVSPDGENGYP